MENSGSSITLRKGSLQSPLHLQNNWESGHSKGPSQGHPECPGKDWHQILSTLSSRPWLVLGSLWNGRWPIFTFNEVRDSSYQLHMFPFLFHCAMLLTAVSDFYFKIQTRRYCSNAPMSPQCPPFGWNSNPSVLTVLMALSDRRGLTFPSPLQASHSPTYIISCTCKSLHASLALCVLSPLLGMPFPLPPASDFLLITLRSTAPTSSSSGAWPA